MKKLYIQYFAHEIADKPAKSVFVIDNQHSEEVIKQNIKDHIDSIMSWMDAHPEGSVSFVWE